MFFGSVGLFVLLSVFGLNIYFIQKKRIGFVAYNATMPSLSFCLFATLLKCYQWIVMKFYGGVVGGIRN